jgi:uncharacterized protein (DUF488 family)
VDRIRLLTVGHGRLTGEELTDVLDRAGVRQLVDVRRFPASRRNPSVAGEELATSLPARGIGYRWEERLGGRRSLGTAKDASPDTWWEVDAFRAYAGWTREPDFTEALDELLAAATEDTTAVMCSESVWWRCHRRLIADVAVIARGAGVGHLMHDGRITDHPPAAGARLTPAGVVWDG